MTTSSMTIDTSSGPKHVSASGGPGRRKTKSDSSSQKKNKQPQRGLGVEKLEHLRLQTERGQNMTFRQPSVNYFNGVADHPPQHQRVYQNMRTNELSSIQNNLYFNCVSDSCGACHKKKRISGGGSSTWSVNQFRNYAHSAHSSSNNAFGEGRPRRVQVREVKEVMPVQRNGMNLMTEYQLFPGENIVGNAGEMMRTGSFTWCGSGLGVGVSGGGTSVDGSMLGLRTGDGSCVTGVTGNEEGCVSSVDLTLKLSYN
ncbi:hypothetical protein CTI12_AA034710 [Artemisia annua]|uniref:Uncharacterized protein n=1 Tax=Artemisia annua TaxID=35608 RepID=A0A2U1PU60_ARTAN|nr:hypothetical protein CTI12_AA034710 [Artemisia annua]